jgi:hypothetical protein
MARGRFLGLEEPDPDEPWTIYLRPKPSKESELALERQKPITDETTDEGDIDEETRERSW